MQVRYDTIHHSSINFLDNLQILGCLLPWGPSTFSCNLEAEELQEQSFASIYTLMFLKQHTIICSFIIWWDSTLKVLSGPFSPRYRPNPLILCLLSLIWKLHLSVLDDTMKSPSLCLIWCYNQHSPLNSCNLIQDTSPYNHRLCHLPWISRTNNLELSTTRLLS